MKFSEKLAAHLTPEWRQQYISYVDLKGMIINCSDNAPIPNIESARVMNVYYATFEEEFFFDCEKELRKVNNFYAEKLAEANRRFEALSTTLDVIVTEFRLKRQTKWRCSLYGNNGQKTAKKLKKSKMEELRNAYSELYLSLVLLQNYKILNYTGFRKILKKYDKLLNSEKGAKWFAKNVESAHFYKNAEVDKLIDEVEHNFTQYLENGDRSQAMKKLRVPPLEERQAMGTVFRVGFLMGAFLVLLIVVFLITISRMSTTADNVYGLLLFRGPFYIIIDLFLLGINVLHWRQFGVNHILIFEIDPRKHLTYSHLLEVHGFLGVLWALCVLCFIYADQLHVSPYLFPLILLLIMVAILLMPLPIFHSSARWWLIKLMVRVCCAPFFAVGFADFWFGDQLVSLVHCLVDFKYIVCFYIYKYAWNTDFKSSGCLEYDIIGNSIIRCLPAWIRFAQCVRRYRDTKLVHPFLINAGKYLSTFPMVIFAALMAIYEDDYENFFDNPFVWCYIFAAIIQTLYCYSWDILRDFSLFENFFGKHIFLRDQIIYPAKFYYCVIFGNLVMRFFWAISLFVRVHMSIDFHVIDTVAGCLDIFRRYIWNYIRLENEHLFNVGAFRAVRDIFIAPIDEIQSFMNLEKMMDEDDGVQNRKQKKHA